MLVLELFETGSMNMDSKKYQKISSYCYRKLIRAHHSRHLEDLIQYVAMRVFEQPLSKWDWCFSDYCRENGLSRGRGRVAAQTLERSVFVGIDNPNDEENNRGFLLDVGEVEKFKDDNADKDCPATLEERLEEFLLPLNLKEGALRWALKTYQPKPLRTKEKTLRMSLKRFR
jgi:hypothetical protein